jgi:hypothetical protein
MMQKAGVTAGHTLPPKILGFSPKFLYKPLNSLLPLILENWKENFEKEILEKGNPNLGITMLFRSSKPVDVIIITQGNRGHPFPQNPKGLAQGII